MLVTYFRSFGFFSEEQIADFVSLTATRQLGKNELFAKEDEISDQVAFIKSGIFRSCYNTANGDDITYCFRFPGELLASYSSYITGNASVENLQAIAPAELLVISKENIQKLIDQHQNWTIFSKIIAEQQYLELEERIFQLQRNTASERYALLLENQPQYLQQIPLQYLASYLGVTQRHLSRIRRGITF